MYIQQQYNVTRRLNTKKHQNIKTTQVYFKKTKHGHKENDHTELAAS